MTSRKSPGRDGDSKSPAREIDSASKTNRNPSVGTRRPSRNIRSHQRSDSHKSSNPEPKRSVDREEVRAVAAAESKPSVPQSLNPMRSREAIRSQSHQQLRDALADQGQTQANQSPAGTPRRGRQARSDDEVSKARNVKARSVRRIQDASQTTIQGRSVASKKSSSQSTEEGSPVNGSPSESSSSYSGTHRRRGEKNGMSFCVDYGFSLSLKKDESPEADRLTMFRNLVGKYNREFGNNHPRMLQLPDHIDLSRWCSMIYDIDKPGPASSMVFYLKTPMVDTGGDWHGHIEATWKFLEANYRVNVNCPHLYMFIGVSLRGYNVSQLVRFVQAAVHFEPAIWAMTPHNKCKRNYDENPKLRGVGTLDASGESSRAAAIMGIEKMCRKLTPAEQLVWLFQTFTPENESSGMNVALGGYLWNIANDVPDDGGGSMYVTLLVPAPLATGGEGDYTGRTNWPRFSLSFLRSAMSCVSGSQLKQYTNDAAGLRHFMGGNNKAVFGPSDTGVLDFVEVATGKPMPAGSL